MLAPLDAHLGFWLRKLSNLVSESFAARLEAHDVTVPQWVLLRTMFDRPPGSLGSLAEALGTDMGAISRMVERLLKKGLVAREPDPTDRRAVVLRLTAEGRALVPALAAEADDNDAQFFKTLSAGEREAFLKTIQQLIRENGATAAPPIS
jgi:DNA-binding MarR family transcriptional regulator